MANQAKRECKATHSAIPMLAFLIRELIGDGFSPFLHIIGLIRSVDHKQIIQHKATKVKYTVP